MGLWDAYRGELELWARGHPRWRVLVYEHLAVMNTDTVERPFLGADWWQGVELASGSMIGSLLDSRTGKRSSVASVW